MTRRARALAWARTCAGVGTPGAPPATAPASGPVGSQGVFGSIADFGKALFTVQLLPFEVTALVLMVAVIGVITLGGEQMREAGPRAQAATDRRMREAILREGKG